MNTSEPLTIFGENTKKGQKNFRKMSKNSHQAFRSYVLTNGQSLDIDKVSTGEHWLAKDAFDLKLVDNLKTSDDYLVEKMAEFNVFKIIIHGKKSMVEKLFKPVMKLLHPWA